jgi:ParB family chromosome partitioning protein
MADTILITDIDMSGRFREEMGDIEELAESIRSHGLLHPVVVTSDKKLIAGRRRIEALKLLGVEQVPVTVMDPEDLLSAELDENTVRKDFTPSEAAAIGRELEKNHKAEIAARRAAWSAQGAAIQHGKVVPGESPWTTPVGQTRDVVGKAVGMSGWSYDRVKRISAAAEADPDMYGDLVEEMDRTGTVNASFEELKSRQAGNPPQPVTSHPERDPRGPADGKQRKLFTSGWSALITSCTLADQITIPDSMTAEELDECLNQLPDCISGINRLRTKLRTLKGKGNTP